MNLLTLPKEQRELLVEIGYKDKLDAVDEGIRRSVPILKTSMISWSNVRFFLLQECRVS
jgi:hypothetical protein